jgi:hypothetical protein
MAAYFPPNYNQDGVYNEYDYTSMYQNTAPIDTSSFALRSGCTFSGDITAPSITLYDINGSLEFPDATEQTTAFTQAYIDLINNPLGLNTTHIKTTDITFVDNSIQDTALTTALINKISSNDITLTNTSYTAGTNMTSISNNTYCANLTCGNINTSYLSTLTSNAQTQLSTKASLTESQTLLGINTLSNPSNVYYGDGSNLSGIMQSSSESNIMKLDAQQTVTGINRFSNTSNVYYGRYYGDGTSLLLSNDVMYASIPQQVNSQKYFNNPLNIYYGDGSNLTGIVPASVMKCDTNNNST